MVANTVFFWVLPTMFAVFAGVFAAIAHYEPKVRSARWAAYAFGIAMLGVILDTVRSPFPAWLFSFAVPLHWAAVICLINAFLSRHETTMPRLPTLVIFAVGLSINLWATFVDPQVTVRMPNANLTALVLLTLGLVYLYRYSDGLLNRITVAIFTGGWMCYAIRSGLYFMLDQSKEYASHPQWSQYMMLFYFTSGIISLAVAVHLVLTMTHDLLAAKQAISHVDELTGIGNRRALEQLVNAHETDGPTIGAVIMIDLDHFKQINDEYGHAGGDAVLAVTASVLQQHIAGSGTVVRMGGEEFAVLIHDSHKEASSAIAHLLRTAISATRLSPPFEDTAITASLGVADLGYAETVSSALRRADIALYAAKAKGRNRAEIAPHNSEAAPFVSMVSQI
jgi:diguanylate cyclase (GGDEF)-like protein